jgi:hypothetical protein
MVPVIRAAFRDTIDPPWTGMNPVAVGAVPSGAGTPSTYVVVERDGAPLLRIDVHDEPAAFQDVIGWANLIVFGFGDCVHFVSPGSRQTVTVRLSDYFGHLYPVEGRLLVADARCLRCFDENGSLLWRSSQLAIDGVVVERVADGVVVGEGEWDPPGGWRPFRVLLSTGAVVPSAQ